MTGRRLAAVVVLAAASSGCWSSDELDPLPVPSSPPTAPTSTTLSVDRNDVSLAPARGTTTTTAVVVGPGAATLVGRVDGPDGPVEGATVRIERLVGNDAAALEVLTGPGGTWRATGVLGGRYRVRAWRQPDQAVVESQLVFVAASGTAEVSLRADRFAGAAVDVAVAPDPPVVGERANVVLRVAERTVDSEGVVRPVPRPGVEVTLAAASGWEPESPLSAVTDDAGRVTYTLVCRAAGTHGLIATVGPGQAVPLSPPECVEPPPPTTPTTGGPAAEG